MKKGDVYYLEKNGCKGIPNGSKINIFDLKGDYFSFTFNRKWYGYYNVCLLISEEEWSDRLDKVIDIAFTKEEQENILKNS